MRRSRINLWIAALSGALLAALLAGGCDQRGGTPANNGTGGGATLFTEVTAKLGLPESAAPWPDGQYHTPEITPGGVALFDYDNDGDLDIYQVRHPPPGPYPGVLKVAAPNRLYQQQADGTFIDVTDAAGVGDGGYGHGAAVGDVDNDGDLDLYVTNLGPDRFYLNNGNGTFTDATAAAGFSGDHWSSAVAFVDYDRDGDLDLYVVHFGVYDPSRQCTAADGQRDYCGPQQFDGVLDTLYRNNGDGTFTDVTMQARINAPGRGWGVFCADLSGDGWPDFYVANDEEPNQLWINHRDGTFADEAVVRGCAVNGAGNNEASMGVTVGDVNGDGVLDLFMTHINGETNTLYLGSAAGQYTDASARSHLGVMSLAMTGWGCAFFDDDHDGDLDLAVANGRIMRQAPAPGAAMGEFWNRIAEPNQLFQNDGAGTFTDASSRAGAFATHVEVSHALAVGDLDNDGDLDMVVVNVGNTMRIFRNDAPPPGTHWLMVRPMVGKRDACGALVRLTAAGKTQQRIAHPSYSYLSSNDPRAHFGLGAAAGVDDLTIDWPDGQRERFTVTGVDRVVTVRQGEGQAIQ